jgi:hypothetical protein
LLPWRVWGRAHCYWSFCVHKRSSPYLSRRTIQKWTVNDPIRCPHTYQSDFGYPSESVIMVSPLVSEILINQEPPDCHAVPFLEFHAFRQVLDFHHFLHRNVWSALLNFFNYLHVCVDHDDYVFFFCAGRMSISDWQSSLWNVQSVNHGI